MPEEDELTARLSVRRIVVANVWFSVAAALAAWASLGGWWALSYLIGSCWMTLNFLALAALLSFIVACKTTNRLFIFAFICAKILLLVLVLYWVFQIPHLHHVGLVVGITTLLVVILLKAVGFAAFVQRPARGDTHDGKRR